MNIRLPLNDQQLKIAREVKASQHYAQSLAQALTYLDHTSDGRTKALSDLIISCAKHPGTMHLSYQLGTLHQYTGEITKGTSLSDEAFKKRLSSYEVLDDEKDYSLEIKNPYAISQTFQNDLINALPRFKARQSFFANGKRRRENISMNEVLAAFVSVFSKPAQETVIPDDEKREQKLARSIGTLLSNAFNVGKSQKYDGRSAFDIEKFGFTDSHLYFIGTTNSDRACERTTGSTIRDLFRNSFKTILSEIRPEQSKNLLSILNQHLFRALNLIDVDENLDEKVDENRILIPPPTVLSGFVAEVNKDNQYNVDKLRYFFKLAFHFHTQLAFPTQIQVHYDQSIYDAQAKPNFYKVATGEFEFRNTTIWSVPTNQLFLILKSMTPRPDKMTREPEKYKLIIKFDNESLLAYALKESNALYNASVVHANKPMPENSYLEAIIPFVHLQPKPSIIEPVATLFRRKKQTTCHIEKVRHVRFIS